MLILAYSSTSGSTIKQRLGRPEYSYYFVLREFLPVLEQLGNVIVIDSLEEVDPLYRSSIGRGESCVLLSFAAPHRTPLGLACPTIPVFAWEYDTIPSENWDDTVTDDWSAVLRKLGCAITHSEYAVRAIRDALGPEFPVVSVTAPVWDRFTQQQTNLETRPIISRGTKLAVQGTIVDSRATDLSQFAPRATRITKHEREAEVERRKPLREQLEYALSIVVKRDQQLARRNQDCAYAESIVKKRDATLAERNRELRELRLEFHQLESRAKDAEVQLKLLKRDEMSTVGRLAFVAYSAARGSKEIARRLLKR